MRVRGGAATVVDEVRRARRRDMVETKEGQESEKTSGLHRRGVRRECMRRRGGYQL